MAEHVQAIRFEDDGGIPNNRLPLLFYSEVVNDPSCEKIEALFERNGWPPRWRGSVFTYHHYHSTAHEVLGVASGEAQLMLGGPSGAEFAAHAGDVIVIPAGVGHIRLRSSMDFEVVGAYPPGAEWDLLTGEEGERPQADRNIADVPVPKSDPVYGAKGPLVRKWKAG